MRKLVSLIFLVFAFPPLLLAQENESFLIKAKIKQGSILLGGNVNGFFYKVTDEISVPSTTVEKTRIMANVQLKNAYFIQHDFAVGLVTTINHESLKVDSNPEIIPERRTYLLGGPFTRYYLDNGVFGELSVQAGLLNFSSGHKYNVFEGAVGIGYAYFFNEKFSIEPILSFRYYTEVENERSYTSYGPMLGVGVQAYLLRKKAHVIKKAL